MLLLFSARFIFCMSFSEEISENEPGLYAICFFRRLVHIWWKTGRRFRDPWFGNPRGTTRDPDLSRAPGRHSPEQRRVKLSGLRLTSRLAVRFRIRNAHSVRSRRRGLWHGSLRTSHQHGGGSHQRRDAGHSKVRRSSGPYRGDCDGGREGTVGSPDTDRSLVTYSILFCLNLHSRTSVTKCTFNF